VAPKRLQLRLADVEQLPAETLGFALLASPPNPQSFRRDHQIARFIAQRDPSTGPPGTPAALLLDSHPRTAVALASALARLVDHGLLVAWPPTDPAFPRDGQVEDLVADLDR
jgi:hypothetical protein